MESTGSGYDDSIEYRLEVLLKEECDIFAQMVVDNYEIFKEKLSNMIKEIMEIYIRMREDYYMDSNVFSKELFYQASRRYYHMNKDMIQLEEMMNHLQC